jgi:hypothetical protein
LEHRCETTSKVLIELSVAVRRGGKGTNRLENEEEKPNVTDGSAQRLIAATNAFGRARDRGTPIEDDPRFMSWIDEWVAGVVTMAEVRERYGQLLEARRLARRLHMPEAAPLPEAVFESEAAADMDLAIDEAELMLMLDFGPDEDAGLPEAGAKAEDGMQSPP